MRLGFGLGFNRLNAGGFDPLAVLFGAGEQGFVGEVIPSRLWQDTARTTPVTADGDPVASWELRTTGGGVIYATQSTAGNRPIYNTDGTLHWLTFNGATSNRWLVTPTITPGTDKVQVFAGVRKLADTPGIVVELSVNSVTQAGAMGLFAPGDATPTLDFISRGTAFAVATASGSAAPVTRVVTGIGDISAPRAAIRVDGVQVAQVTTSQGTGNYLAYPIYIGRRSGASSPLNGNLYALIVRFGPNLTENQIVNTETYVGGKTGISASLSSLTTPDNFSESRASVDRGTHDETSIFSRVVYNTEATAFSVTTYNDLYGSFPTLTRIGVYVDGVYSQSINPGAAGVATNAVILPQGSKTVEFVTGPQSKPNSNPPIGVWLTGIRSNAPLAQETPSASNRLLIYGDSIVTGDAADPVQRDAWAMRVRNSLRPRSVAMEAWGFRSLHDDAQDSTARAAFVATVVDYAPSEIWLAIGTNDYGLNKWSAASFGTAYAALLDDLDAAIPGIQIYCQSPIVRSVETANGSGSTLGDYRSQISTAAAARSGFCTFIDGSTILTVGDLSDGVHPTTAGHGTYATAVLAAL